MVRLSQRERGQAEGESALPCPAECPWARSSRRTSSPFARRRAGWTSGSRRRCSFRSSPCWARRATRVPWPSTCATISTFGRKRLSQLMPLDAAEKPKYGLADVATRLAYRYESPKYATSLVVERTRPRLTARTFSFVRVEPSRSCATTNWSTRSRKPGRRSSPSCCRKTRRRRFRSSRSTA